jgi:hypothetical protein
MSSWTSRQIEILMEWVEENNEYSEKSIWTKRYYETLYFLIFLPSIIITAYLSANPDASFIIPVIINQVITAIDKMFNFGKLASEYEGYSNLYQNFSDRILEELVKPEAVKQDGSVFYHDMNWEKQRLGDKTRAIPWIIEKIYTRYKNKKAKSAVHHSDDYEMSSDHSNSSQHGIVYPARYTAPVTKTPSGTIVRRVRYTAAHTAAAIVIQRAWRKYRHRNDKLPSLVNNIIDTDLTPKAKKQPVRAASFLINQKYTQSSCNILLPNPQTKMQKKLAKLIHERTIDPPSAEDNQLHNAMYRFNNNFDHTPTHDDFLQLVQADRRARKFPQRNSAMV